MHGPCNKYCQFHSRSVCAAVISPSHSQSCRNFVLGQRSCFAVVQETMAAAKCGPSDKALQIILTDQNWFKNFPQKIFIACVKFSGNQSKI